MCVIVSPLLIELQSVTSGDPRPLLRVRHVTCQTPLAMTGADAIEVTH